MGEPTAGGSFALYRTDRGGMAARQCPLWVGSSRPRGLLALDQAQARLRNRSVAVGLKLDQVDRVLAELLDADNRSGIACMLPAYNPDICVVFERNAGQ